MRRVRPARPSAPARRPPPLVVEFFERQIRAPRRFLRRLRLGGSSPGFARAGCLDARARHRQEGADLDQHRLDIACAHRGGP